MSGKKLKRKFKTIEDYFKEAEEIENFIFEQGITQKEYAGIIGHSQGYVANKLRLLKLEPELRQSVMEAKLSERHVRALTRLPSKKSRADMIEEIKAEHYTSIELEMIMNGGRKYVDEVKKIKGQKEREKCLRSFKKYCENCVKNGNYGSLKVSEESDDIIKKIAMSSDVSREVARKNISSVKLFLKNLRKLLTEVETQGIVVKVNVADDDEEIKYSISFPKKDNLLWK